MTLKWNNYLQEIPYFILKEIKVPEINDFEKYVMTHANDAVIYEMKIFKKFLPFFFFFLIEQKTNSDILT